jgi:uncharacterized membrane protein
MEFLAILGLIVLIAYLATPFVVLSMLGRMRDLESKLRDVQRDVSSLKTSLARPEPPPILDDAATVEVAPPECVPSSGAEITDVARRVEGSNGSREEGAAISAESIAPPPLTTSAMTEPTPIQWSSAAIEWLAERWMAWVGATALLSGLGFFLKYAMDRGWIGPEIRVMMGLSFGAALFGLGAVLLKRDYRPVGQGVAGSSLGFWYLSLYAAHHWNSLIPEGAMFGGMAIGAGAVLALAAAFDAEPVAILGVLGGFLAPLLMTTSTPSPWPLFRYILVVDAAALAAASFRRWRIAELAAFGATAFLWVSWLGRVYTPLYLFDVLALLTIFFTLFIGVVVWNFFLKGRTVLPADLVLVFATPLAYGFSVYDLTKPLYSRWHGAMAIGLAAVYATLSIVGRRLKADQGLLADCLTGVALSFVAVAAPLQFTGHWIPIAWAAYAAVLVTIGLRRDVPAMRLGGFALLGLVQVLMAGYVVETLVHPHRVTPWWLQRPSWIDAPIFTGPWSFVNGRSLSMLANAVALGWIAREYRRHSGLVPAWEAGCRDWAMLGAAVGAAGGTVLETFAYVFSRSWPAETFAGLAAVIVSLFVGATALLAARFGPRWLFDVARVTALLLLVGLAMACVAAANNPGRIESLTRRPLWGSPVFFNPRGAAFVSTLLMAIFVVAIARRRPDLTSPAEQASGWTPASQFAFMALLTAWLTAATETFALAHVRHWTTTQSLAFSTLHLSALTAAAITLTARMGPFSSSAVAVVAAIALAGTSLGLAVGTFDERVWSNEATGSLWLLSAVVNPRGLAFAAAAASLIWFARVTRRLPRSSVAERRERVSLYEFSAILAHLTLWLAITVEVYALGLSQQWGTGKSLGVSIAWTAYGLGLFGVGLAWRWTSVRLASLVVFVVTTAKVFLLDVWELAPVIRYVAFIGLGVALLSTSYFYRRFKDRLREFIANPDAKR